MDAEVLRRIYSLDEEETRIILDSLLGPETTPRRGPEDEVRYWSEEKAAA